MFELLMIHSNTWNNSILLTFQIELFEIELFAHLTVCKQMTDVLRNYLGYIAVLENIKLCTGKWLILDRIICIR